MDYKELSDVIKTKMNMQHVYQPLMIKTLLESNNHASTDQIAKAFLEKDQSQIDYYKIITKNMPGKVLRSHGITDYKNGKFHLMLDDITDEQRENMINLCIPCPVLPDLFSMFVFI